MSKLPRNGATGSGLLLIKGSSRGDAETEALHTSEAKKRCGGKERVIVADEYVCFENCGLCTWKIDHSHVAQGHIVRKFKAD